MIEEEGRGIGEQCLYILVQYQLIKHQFEPGIFHHLHWHFPVQSAHMCSSAGGQIVRHPRQWKVQRC